MQKATGDIWNLAESHFVVIPTNYGWNSRLQNPMGRGLALQAAKRFPELPAIYGKICRDTAFSETPDGSFAPLPFAVWSRSSSLFGGDQPGLILFVVKPLNKDAPHLSWASKADLGTIKASCQCLVDWMQTMDYPLVAMPLVGCGAGGLWGYEVMPVLEEYFGQFDNVVLVTTTEKGERDGNSQKLDM